MNETAKKLTRILELHVKDHTSLLALEDAKRKAIIKNNTVLLEELIKEEEKIINEVGGREKMRKEYSSQLCVELGVAKEEKLSTLIDALNDSECSRVLSEIKEKLNTIIEELRFRTSQNTELLYRSVEHIGAFFRTIAEATTISPTYQRNGQKDGTQRRLLDQMA